MSLPIILYCGPADVSSDVFEQYMSCLGYSVVIVPDPDALVETLASYAHAILILAFAEPPDRLTSRARRIRRYTSGRQLPIFILSHETFDPKLPCTFVIPRPQALKQVVERIRGLSA